MKQYVLLALLAVGLTTNVYAQDADSEENEKKSTDLVLKSGDKGEWTMHFGVGVNVATNVPSGYDFAPFKSWDFLWTIAQYDYKPGKGKQTFSAGIGLNFRNYGLRDNNTAFQKSGDVTSLGTFPESAGSRSSRVHTVGIHVPLLFTQEFGKHFSVTVGPIVNFNVGGWINNSYEDGDDTVDVSTRKIGQRPVTVELMGVFDIYGIGLFCKYSPMSVFKDDRGPQFKSITFGLYL